MFDLPCGNLSSLQKLRLKCFTLYFGKTHPATDEGRQGHSSQGRSRKAPGRFGAISAALRGSTARTHAGADATADAAAATAAAGAGNSSAQASPCSSNGGTDAETDPISSSAGAAAAAAATAAAAARCPSALLPQLRVLDLRGCTISLETFQQLTELTALSELHIAHPEVLPPHGERREPGGPTHVERVAGELRAWLEQLPDLTQLTLCAGHIYKETSEPVSRMTKLQSLSLTIQHNRRLQPNFSEELNLFSTSDHTLWPEVVGVLLADSLTALHLEGTLAELTPRTAPGLSKLAGLQRFTMGRYSLFAPELLQDLRQLRHLSLDGCKLALFLPAASPRAQGVGQAAGVAGAAGASVGTWERPQRGDRVLVNTSDAVRVLLSELQHMTQLQALALTRVNQLSRQPLQLCKALTASSQLTSLKVVMHEGLPLPCGALKSMFPCGRQLSQLQKLTIACAFGDAVRMFGQFGSGVRCVDRQDLAAVAAACPRLRELELLHVLQQGSALKALLPLQASLANMYLAGQTADDYAAEAVGQLTGLRKLQWWEAHKLTDAGLQHLTALTGLTELFVYHCGGVGQQVYHWFNTARGQGNWFPPQWKATWDPEQVGGALGATVCQQLQSVLSAEPPLERPARQVLLCMCSAPCVDI